LATDVVHRRGLQATLDERVVIDQARGIVAERLVLDLDAAFVQLRDYAHAVGRRLGDLADDIVAARLGPEELTRRLHAHVDHRPASFETRAG
jgi:hypothetical protein